MPNNDGIWALCDLVKSIVKCLNRIDSHFPKITVKAVAWDEKKGTLKLSKESLAKLEKEPPQILLTRIEALFALIQSENHEKPLLSLDQSLTVVVDQTEALDDF